MKIVTRTTTVTITVFIYISTLHARSENKLTKSFSDPLKCRSSRSQMFFKIGALKNFANFKGKHLCWSLFLIKLQAPRPTILLKRDSVQFY